MTSVTAAAEQAAARMGEEAYSLCASPLALRLLPSFAPPPSPLPICAFCANTA